MYLASSEAEVWMPTRVKLEDHVAALERAQRDASPVQMVQRPTMERTRTGRRPVLSESQR